MPSHPCAYRRPPHACPATPPCMPSHPCAHAGPPPMHAWPPLCMSRTPSCRPGHACARPGTPPRTRCPPPGACPGTQQPCGWLHQRGWACRCAHGHAGALGGDAGVLRGVHAYSRAWRALGPMLGAQLGRGAEGAHPSSCLNKLRGVWL